MKQRNGKQKEDCGLADAEIKTLKSLAQPSAKSANKKSYVLTIRTGMRHLVKIYFSNFDIRLYLQLVQTFNVRHHLSDLIFGKHC